MRKAARNRSTKSCARCYLNKKKCDKKVPSCTRCIEARAQCLAIDRSTETELPRSVLQYLEEHLHTLEQSNPNGHSQGRLDPPVTALAHDHGAYDGVVDVGSIAVSSVCTPEVIQDQRGLFYESKLFYSSERPPLKIPVKGIYNEDPPRMASQGTSSRGSNAGALRIPREVSKILFDNYISSILPTYPCFTEEDLVSRFAEFNASRESLESVVPDTTWFIVYMVLAISALTSKAQDFRKVASLAESLHQDAMRHSAFLGIASMESLQCLLLLIQAALLLPYTSNLWYLSGEATRLAIALGLHQEPGPCLRLDSSQTNFRRMVFWMVYQFERTVAIASGCPLAISDEHITTKMPFQDDASQVDNSESRILRPSKLRQFLSYIQLCQLQSTIHLVQYFDQGLPGDLDDYGSWVQNMEAAIQAWQQSSIADGATPAWWNNAADHCRLLLHRPCSRNIVPAESSLEAAASTAIKTLNGYWNLSRMGNPILSFQYVYNVFQAAMVLLYTMRNHGSTIRMALLEDAAKSALDSVVPLFEALSTRWPVASDTGYWLKDLKETILRGSVSNYDLEPYDVNLLAELDFLVTQRRIHSIYHRNLAIPIPDANVYSDVSTWLLANPFQPFANDMWNDVLNTDFDFDTSALTFFDTPEEIRTEPVEPDPSAHASVPNGSSHDHKALAEIDNLVASIPACSACRNHHIRCDRIFPSCRACDKARRDCTYFDSMLEQEVHRGYIYGLYEKIKQVYEGMNGRPTVAQGDASEAPEVGSSHDIHLPFSGLCVSANPPGRRSISRSGLADKKAQDSIYFGAGSCLSLLRQVQMYHPSPPSTDIPQPGRSLATSLSSHGRDLKDIQRPTIAFATSIFLVFSNSVNVFYPTLKQTQLDSILASFYSEEKAGDTSGFYLILAAGSRLGGVSSAPALFSPEVYFQKAMCQLDRSRYTWVFTDQLLLLQKTLLICIYLLLSPSSGDIWRVLGFAIRLYFDLSHRPSENDDMDEELLYMLSRTLYCLESQVCVAYGRPSLLAIGDKVREDFTKTVSNTINERVSIFFYRISVLKMQIQNSLLVHPTRRGRSTDLETQLGAYRREVKSCLTEWKSDSVIADRGDAVGVLHAWADLHAAHAAFLIAATTSTDDPSEILPICEDIIASAGLLVRHQKKAVLLGSLAAGDACPVFPANWTMAHLVFSVGLALSRITNMPPVPGPPSLAAAALRRCMAVLALLEADATNLATGFSEVLEGLCGT